MKRYYFNLAFILCVMSLSAQGNDKPGQSVKEYVIPEIDMVYVGGGTFTMGCTDEQGRDCNVDEKPAQWVKLGSFYIGKYEVTQKQWRDVMGTDPSYFKGDNLPVERVSWNDVQDFIGELNQKTGKNYRLPTEAEWEYAARGGNQSQGFKYSGGNSAKGVAWYESNMTHPIGIKQANILGIYDMSGNVAEWCGDWYGDYNNSPQTNPQGVVSGSDRVSRGGGWLLSAWNTRVSSRDDYPPDYKFANLGFRLACDSVQDINKDRREVTGKSSVNEEDSTFTAIPQKSGVNEGDSAITAIPQKSSVNEGDSAFTAIPPIDMVYVAGGTFTMGCTDEQGDDCYPNENPAHQVTLSPYYIGKYEVTQKQWRDVMGTNLSYFENDSLPVESVNWNDVQDFIGKLNQKTGKNYRLPTEAEWEYAARGGNQSQGYKYSGGNTVSEVAWYDDNLGDETYPVGTKQANELGIYDMSGNVAEWCGDWYGDYNNNPQTNPQGVASGSDRVSRGGGWLLCVWNARVSSREGYSPDSQFVYLGFRLACDAK